MLCQPRFARIALEGIGDSSRRVPALVVYLCLSFVLIPAQCVHLAAAEQPNVIVILTDDQGWGDLSLHGNQNLETPNLDKIGRLGARFDRFYVCPVCAPTRAEFLTGRYHPRGGVRGVTSGAERLDLDETTIAQHFRANGYRTAAFGKWHNGMQYPYHPLARGFEEFYGYCSGHWGDYFSPQLERNGELVEGDGYLVDDFTNHALQFIEQHAQEKFFLYLPMPTPHGPMQVPDEFWESMQDRSLKDRARDQDNEDPEFTKAALAMVECIDANVGRILARLDELELSENTILVYFCDNGPNSFRWNGDMKGKKGSTDEGGVRSPLFVCWPQKIRPRLITQVCGAIDLLPTLSELCEVPIVGGKPLDGVSLKPIIDGRVSSLPDRLIFSHWNKRVSVRVQHYRMDHTGQLFDMVADPGQRTPVNDEQPGIANELKQYVDKWKAEMLPLVGEDTRRFPIGHPAFALTQLPARDGIPHGGITRSARAPNCSYFTNWRETTDAMTWDGEVLAGGNFQVQAYYCCGESNLGSEIEISVGDSVATATITEANDPPAVGAEHDRVPRKTQSFMKDFKPLSFGPIQLADGPANVTVRAKKLVGDEPLELRMLMFRRVR